MQVLLGFGGCLTPIVLAALARDRSLMSMISSIKDDASSTTKATGDALHERINRVRDEFVRRDDFEAHLARFDKRMDEFRDEMRRSSERTDERLEAILEQLRDKPRRAT